jgi:hypothetical protein
MVFVVVVVVAVVVAVVKMGVGASYGCFKKWVTHRREE